MRKIALISFILAAILLTGCAVHEEKSSVSVHSVETSSSVVVSSAISANSDIIASVSSQSASTSTSADSSSISSSTSSASSSTISSTSTASTTTVTDRNGKKITVELDENGNVPYEYRSSTGVVWDYPINSNLTYNFASGKVLKALEQRYGKTGKDLGYMGEWCAEVLSDLLIKNGYQISPKLNPCDLAIQLLNKNYAHFYCIREENFNSLVQYGLNKKGQGRIIMTTSKEFTPKRGDLVCFLWNEENDVYNWSHIGIVAEDYDGKVLRTIEGNVGTVEFPDDPRIRSVGGRERLYNETVVGFIRLDY